MIPDLYTPFDLLPIAFVAIFVAAIIIAATWIADWIESGRPSPLLERYRHWFDRVCPVEEYPGQYGPVELTPEQIERRERTYAEADALWGDEAAQVSAEWARIEAVINAEDIAMWEREMGEVA